MRRGVKHRAVTALVLVPALVAGGLALPVLGSLPGERTVLERDPVDGTVTALPISGVDPVVVEEASAAMASWNTLVDSVHVGDLGLGGEAKMTFADQSHGEDDHQQLKPAIAAQAESVDEFTLVGVTADQPFDPATRVLVRVREGDVWSAWEPLTINNHGLDDSSPEVAGIRYGTSPLLTETADGIQLRIDTPGGLEPEGTEIMLVDNPVTDEDALLPDPPDPSKVAPVSVAHASTAAGMPQIITRAEWGANERWRRGAPRYSSTIKAAVIHHTASRNNNYSPEQAAQQVRNLYSWFTRGLRYSDMGYNFLIDRFGRLYEGRAGGMDRPVIGGHTAGFNDQTFSVSAIGNFNRANSPAADMGAIVDSIASLTAWKLAMHHRDPNGRIPLVSDSASGTSRFQPGQTANALVVGGHGDIGATSCPGRHLSAQIPAVRAATAAKMGPAMFNPVANPATWAQGPMSITAAVNAPMNWSVTITNRCGNVVRTLGGQHGEPGIMQIDWDQRDDAGNQVPPGIYTVSMNVASGELPLYPWVGTTSVAPTDAAPPDPCGETVALNVNAAPQAPATNVIPESFTLTGAGFGHGVGMSQYGALAKAREGFDATAIVTHYYQGTSVSPVQDDMALRVNVQHRKKHVWVRGEAVEGDGTVQANLNGTVVTAAPGESFEFTGAQDAVRAVKVAGGSRQNLGSFPRVSLTWSGLAHVVNKGQGFGSTGNRYRYGSIEVSPTGTSANTQLNAVNVLRLRDEYLYGISEVSSSWPEAALQAQVLAARTYALSAFEAGIRRACDCHVDDGRGPFTDQMFTGWSKQSGPQGNRWVNAVNATHTSPSTGLAILFDGKPIRAFYSSSNGGATQASADQWGGDLPYVRSVPDPWSLSDVNPNRSWSVTIDQAAMGRAFGASDVANVQVVARDPSGVARTVQATLADGRTVTRTGNQLRSALRLRSAFINEVAAGAGVPASTPQAPTVALERQVAMRTPADRQVKARSSFPIRATVTPRQQGLRVWFQRKENDEWVTIKRARTKKNGTVAHRVRQAWPPGTTQEYRVVVVRKQQPIGIGETTRVQVIPSVKPRTVRLLTPQSIDVAAGKPITIRARVTPQRAGLTVWRQALVDGEWQTVQRSKTNKKGRVSFRINRAAPAGANYTYRLVAVEDQQAAGASPDITVNVGS